MTKILPTLLEQVLEGLEGKGKVVGSESGMPDDPYIWELTHSGALDLPRYQKTGPRFQESETALEASP